MTDPTIPELVARLRELHAELQALQVGTPEFTAARQLALQLSAPGILDALDHVGDANKMVPHSPDGGKVELPEHLETELELLRTQRALSDTERDYLRASAEADRLFERAVAAESLTTWRPISEPPSAEVHAWCDGWYLFREPLYDPQARRIHSLKTWESFERDGAEWLPIPPSDERRG